LRVFKSITIHYSYGCCLMLDQCRASWVITQIILHKRKVNFEAKVEVRHYYLAGFWMLIKVLDIN
jgi:hypothetical protein